MVALSTEELSITMIGIALLIFSAFVGGKIFEKIKAPKVVGEIIGGFLLGYSCLGYFCPEIFNSIFMAFSGEEKILSLLYNLGIIFLMFISGYTTELEINRDNIGLIGKLYIGATILPILLGFFFINYYEIYFIGVANNKYAFLIVFFISIVVTSIPVISKIFFDLDILDTKFSSIVLATSTIQDLTLWIALNIATNLVADGEFDYLNSIFVSALTLGLIITVKYSRDLFRNVRLDIPDKYQNVLIMTGLLGTVGYISKLGINTMYASFIVGYMIKNLAFYNEGIEKKINIIQEFAFSFFIPIFFALVGIQLDIINNFSITRFISYFILACILEWVGCIISLRFTNLSKSARVNFAFVMNCRGGPGIVLATVSYAAGIINSEFFTVLILTSMLSSLICGYWLRYEKNKHKEIFTCMEQDIK